MAKPCRINVLGEVAAALGGVPPDEVLPPCSKDAEFTVIHSSTALDVTVRVDAPLCAEHEAVVSKSSDHERSIKLRTAT